MKNVNKAEGGYRFEELHPFATLIANWILLLADLVAV